MPFQRSPEVSTSVPHSKSWAAKNREQIEVLDIGLSDHGEYYGYSSLYYLVKTVLRESPGDYEIGFIIPDRYLEVARDALFVVLCCPISPDRDLEVCQEMLSRYPMDQHVALTTISH